MRNEKNQRQDLLQKVFKRFEGEVSPIVPDNTTEGLKVSSAWSNNWADWDNDAGHNNWDNQAPSPPGGK